MSSGGLSNPGNQHSNSNLIDLEIKQNAKTTTIVKRFVRECTHRTYQSLSPGPTAGIAKKSHKREGEKNVCLWICDIFSGGESNCLPGLGIASLANHHSTLSLLNWSFAC